MKVLFVAAEAHPFIKVGGLGDVAYALPKALRKNSIDTRVILPKYWKIPKELKDEMKTIAEFTVPVGWRNQYCGLQYLEYDGIPFYFIDNEYYFNREAAYGYYDDGERYAFFDRAVLEAIKYMGDFRPDVIHCNDWHSGMIPPMLKGLYPDLLGIKTVFTIHNLQYQGVFSKDILGDLLGFDDSYYNENALKHFDGVSFMKGGLNFADKISTVSWSYAEEIKTPYYGEGLDGLLSYRSNDLWGILNGIDYDIFNPNYDKDIYNNFNAEHPEGKNINKRKLQKKLGLPICDEVPLIGIVTRLVKQKGLDLVSCILEELLQQEVQLVIVGTGDNEYQNMFNYFEWRFPNKVSANITFDNDLAKKVYASCDMFLMPSQFEPCGIGQLLALRYGTIPIVRETGGLKDTVKAFNEYDMSGNGFSFSNYNAHDMLNTIKRAIYFYYDKDVWNQLVVKAMEEDNSWVKSANTYFDLYKNLW
jgi:starch synthase